MMMATCRGKPLLPPGDVGLSADIGYRFHRATIISLQHQGKSDLFAITVAGEKSSFSGTNRNNVLQDFSLWTQ
jgi:hypothetical protein